MKTIILLGSEGQLGTALQHEMALQGIDFIALDRPEFDILNLDSFERIMQERKVEAVINCAAYTNVPKAETEVEAAMQINGSALKPLSELCDVNGVYLIHISTDYVFDGRKGSAYIEDDLPNPVSIYGMSKLMGEMMVRRYAGQYAIVRTAGVYGHSNLNSDNIVEKLIRFGQSNPTLKMVTDEVTSPTWSVDLARQILVILEKRIQGIIHATSNGECNWLEFGRCIFETLGMNVELEPVPSSFFNKNLHKPLYSVLQNAVLKDLFCDQMPDWRSSLILYLKSRQKSE